MLKMNSPYVDANLTSSPKHAGRISGLTFAVKDVMAIKDHVIGLGNPTWQQEHQPETTNAWVVEQLLNQGANLHGAMVSDEFMFSIKGNNLHYGAPLNPKHPDAYTGGSSSGSASVVASNLVDFALGTDTGGSVRVPASYCGIYGFRPTHSLKMLDGVAPLSTSFDTVGVLANQAKVLNRVGKALYTAGNQALTPRKIYFLDDVRFSQDLAYDYGQKVRQIAHRLGINNQQIKPLHLNLAELLTAFKRIQGFEAWQNYGDWISIHHTEIGQDIADHFAYAASVANDVELAQTYQFKDTFAKYLAEQLGGDAIIVLPTTSSPAPLKKLAFETVEVIRSMTQQLTAIAGLSGLPQVALPLDDTNSISIISGRNTDQALLHLVVDELGFE